MTMTRRSTRLLMHEITTPDVPPADALWLFARDNGSGVTVVTAEFPGGALQNLTDGTGGGGGGTGGEFLNVNRDYGGSIASALADARSGDTVFINSPTYTVGSMLTIPAGVRLKGQRLVGESNYSTIASSTGFGSNPLLKLLAGASVEGINANALDGSATHAIQCAGDGCALEHVTTRGGSQFGTMNLPGTGHQWWAHLRNMGGPTHDVMQVNGDFNTVTSTVNTGVAGGHAGWVTGNYNAIGPAHWTGDVGSAAPIRVDGQGNMIFSAWSDTVGSNGRGLIDVRGGHNMFLDCGGMNVGPGLQRPLVSITAKNNTDGSRGNMFFGLAYSKTGSKDNVTLAVKFFDPSGTATASPALFRGTRLYWGSGLVNAVGGAYHNLTGIVGSDGIDIVGGWTGGSNVNSRS